jgi:uncharacterized protein (TIGR02246 family)
MRMATRPAANRRSPSTATGSGETMDKAACAEIERECTALSYAFAYNLDHRNYEALANLFAADGVWVRHGQRLQGHEQIIAALNQRLPNQFTRHVTTNFHFTEVTPTRARSVAYNMSYFSLEGDKPMPLRFGQEQAMLLDFIDLYTLTPHGWRFLERTTTPVLMPDSVRAVLAKSH